MPQYLGILLGWSDLFVKSGALLLIQEFEPTTCASVPQTQVTHPPPASKANQGHTPWAVHRKNGKHDRGLACMLACAGTPIRL